MAEKSHTAPSPTMIALRYRALNHPPEEDDDAVLFLDALATGDFARAFFGDFFAVPFAGDFAGDFFLVGEGFLALAPRVRTMIAGVWVVG